MNHEGPAGLFERRLEALAREIAVWNRQVNLVTRAGTERKLPQMIRHCLDGWELVREALGTHPWFTGCIYVDVGSGAGLPGLVWAAARERDGHAGRSLLVEPRGKRAWFLRRAAQSMALPAVEVANARWGDRESAPGEVGSASALISLKALRLDDATVLAGLGTVARAATPPTAVAIVRFMPPARDEQNVHDREDGPRDPAPVLRGSPRRVRRLAPAVPNGYALEERRILGSGTPSLSLVRYRVVARDPCSTWNVPD